MKIIIIINFLFLFFLYFFLYLFFIIIHNNDIPIKDSPQFGGILNYFKLYNIENFDHDLLLRAYGILHVNSFGIDCYHDTTLNDAITASTQCDGDVHIEHTGTGLYVEASVFDHSCVPNATASGDGLCLEIRALAPIRSGEQIYIDYLQDVLPREKRIRLLAERYFFHCQCAKGCADGLSDPFDNMIDFKRYTVLNRLIDSMLLSGEEKRKIETNQGDNNNKKVDILKRNEEINWSQLYACWKQRLLLQEGYYAAAGYHPCLSLFYREYLRFLLVHQHQLQLVSDNKNINQQQKTKMRNNLSLQQDATPTVTTTPQQVIEQDLLEFGRKAKQHLTITHGTNHSYYSRLFALK